MPVADRDASRTPMHSLLADRRATSREDGDSALEDSPSGPTPGRATRADGEQVMTVGVNPLVFEECSPCPIPQIVPGFRIESMAVHQRCRTL